jgi:hypothetical protein
VWDPPRSQLGNEGILVEHSDRGLLPLFRRASTSVLSRVYHHHDDDFLTVTRIDRAGPVGETVGRAQPALAAHCQCPGRSPGTGWRPVHDSSVTPRREAVGRRALRRAGRQGTQLWQTALQVLRQPPRAHPVPAPGPSYYDDT